MYTKIKLHSTIDGNTQEQTTKSEGKGGQINFKKITDTMKQLKLNVFQ